MVHALHNETSKKDERQTVDEDTFRVATSRSIWLLGKNSDDCRVNLHLHRRADHAVGRAWVAGVGENAPSEVFHRSIGIRNLEAVRGKLVGRNWYAGF